MQLGHNPHHTRAAQAMCEMTQEPTANGAKCASCCIQQLRALSCLDLSSLCQHTARRKQADSTAAAPSAMLLNPGVHSIAPAPNAAAQTRSMQALPNPYKSILGRCGPGLRAPHRCRHPNDTCRGSQEITPSDKPQHPAQKHHVVMCSC